MIRELYVTKQFGTYTDVFLVLGLARLIEQTQQELCNDPKIQIRDSGTGYCLELSAALDLDALEKLQYWHFFEPVQGNKTKMDGIPLERVSPFNAPAQSERRSKFLKHLKDGGKVDTYEGDFPDPRTLNSVVLTSMQRDKNHNKLWLASQDLRARSKFGFLLKIIVEILSSNFAENLDSLSDKFIKLFLEYAGCKPPENESAVALYFPTLTMGVNQKKADTNKVDGSSKKEGWLWLWLIAGGFFEFGISNSVKITEKKSDWKVVALQPRNISLQQYRVILDKFRTYRLPSGKYGVARFDAELVLRFCQQFLNHHVANSNAELSELDLFFNEGIDEYISGFAGTSFTPKAQAYGVKEVFSLGLPDWIRPETAEAVKSYQSLLDEHLAVVRSLSIDEGNGELLSAYRDFITGNDLNQFFRFNISYSDYIVRQLADPKAKYAPKRFSQEGLDIMTRSFDKADQKWSIKDITQNKGFLRIARAINSATVYAGKIKTREGTIELDWQRTYGLAQRLSNQLGSKQDFIAELSAFLTSYGNENVRISEQLLKDNKSLRRVWVTNEDLEQFLVLLDDGQPFKWSLVANLMLAYGYAKWKKPLAGEPDGAPSGDDDNSDEGE